MSINSLQKRVEYNHQKGPKEDGSASITFLTSLVFFSAVVSTLNAKSEDKYGTRLIQHFKNPDAVSEFLNSIDIPKSDFHDILTAVIPKYSTHTILRDDPQALIARIDPFDFYDFNKFCNSPEAQAFIARNPKSINNVQLYIEKMISPVAKK